MAGLSDFFENEILDQLFRNETAPAIPKPYVSLHSGDPGETGVAEVYGNGYIRQSGQFSAAAGGATANTNLLSYTNMPAVTGAFQVGYVGVWDASGAGAGNFVGGGSLVTPKTVNSGDTFQIAIGDLDVTLS